LCSSIVFSVRPSPTRFFSLSLHDALPSSSTGKIKPAATMQVTLVMLQAIRDYYHATGRAIGMKPAGGISNAKLAIHYLVMLRETDRKSTRLNSSHVKISYAVFCLKKKKVA